MTTTKILSDEVAQDVPDRLLQEPNFPGVALRPRLPTRVRDVGAGRYALLKDADHAGVMVALRLPDAAAKRLAVPGGEPAGDLHLTLLYLGAAADVEDDQVEALEAALRAVGERTAPFDARVTGYGRFRAGDRDVLWAGFDAPDLPELRHAVVQAARDSGFDLSGQDHGFTPHVTLAYVPAGEGEDEMPPDVEVRVAEVSLVVGAREVAVPLEGGPDEDAPEALLPAATFSEVQRPSAVLRDPEDLAAWAEGRGSVLLRPVPDGLRCVAVKKGRDVRVAVAGLEGDAQLSDLTSALGRVPHDFVLEGELCAVGLDGEWLPGSSVPDVADADLVATPVLVPSDLLVLDGDVSDHPALERWRLLQALVPVAGAHVVVAPWSEWAPDDEPPLDEVAGWRPSGAEGFRVVAVRALEAGSPYEHGRADHMALLDLGVAKYDPDEPRDQQGQWTGGAGGGGTETEEVTARYPGGKTWRITAGTSVAMVSTKEGSASLHVGTVLGDEEAPSRDTVRVLGAIRHHAADLGLRTIEADVVNDKLGLKVEKVTPLTPHHKDVFGTAGTSGLLAPEQGVFRKPRRSAAVKVGLALNAGVSKGGDGDATVSAPAFGAHTFVVGELVDGELVEDPARVNPYEALFRRPGTRLRKYSDDEPRDDHGMCSATAAADAAESPGPSRWSSRRGTRPA